MTSVNDVTHCCVQLASVCLSVCLSVRHSVRALLYVGLTPDDAASCSNAVCTVNQCRPCQQAYNTCICASHSLIYSDIVHLISLHIMTIIINIMHN